MPPVKLSGRLPDDMKNGLFAPDAKVDFLSNPNGAVYVIGVMTNWKTETNNDTGEVTPVMKFRHIEVVDEKSSSAALEIMQKLHEKRTGELALPFEFGDEIRPEREHEDGGEGTG